MSRMFRIITDSNDVAPSAVVDAPKDAEVPFVEVGGPEGFVTSIPAPRLHTTPSLIETPPPRKPVPAPSDDHLLSVAFHKIPKPGLRLVPAGIAPEVVTHHRPSHPVAEEYRTAVEEIRRQFDNDGPHALLLTSAAPGVGVTTVLLNIAVLLASEASRKVLVVDANFRKPSLSDRLGVAAAPGLFEVLLGKIPLAWAVQATAIPNLNALAAGRVVDTEESESVTLTQLVRQLKGWYDWVLVDPGTWCEIADRDHLASGCDGVLLVARQEEIDHTEFLHLRDSVARSGASLRGYVATRS